MAGVQRQARTALTPSGDAGSRSVGHPGDPTMPEVRVSEDVRGFSSCDAATRSPCHDPAVATVRGGTGVLSRVELASS